MKIFKMTSDKLPPSVNAAYVNIRRGRALTADAKTWYANFTKECLYFNNPKRYFGKDEKLFADVKFIFPDYRRRDSGNFTKLIYDGLVKNGILYDDSQIYQERLTKEIVKRQMGYICHIYLLDECKADIWRKDDNTSRT